MGILFYFFKAVFMGIISSAPIGPISMICIRKSLERGFAGTLAVSVGTAVCDGIFAAIAASGLSMMSDFVTRHESIIKIFGGLVLLYLAYSEIRSVDQYQNKGSNKNQSSLRMMAEAFIVTLFNPLTILAFAGIFATFKEAPTTPQASIALTLGISIGALLWYLFMGCIVIAVRNKLSQKWLHYITYASSIILALFGAYALVNGLIKL